jgi:hypothetical protein
MKKILLFEKFESKSLNKIYSYINKNDLNKFKHVLSSVSKKLDIPMSDIPEDIFQYLPYKKAIYLTKSLESIPCRGPSPNIDGEFCSGPTGDETQGKVKRTWGNHIRNVTCDVCKGTGIVYKKDTDIKWLKFWFSKDGRFICATVTNGQVIRQLTLDSGFTVVEKDLSYRKVNSYETGDIFSIKFTDGKKAQFILYKRDGSLYAIQNLRRGSEPRNSNQWKKYGTYSWCLDSSDFLEIDKIEPEVKEGQDQNPISWNLIYDYHKNEAIESEPDLSDADFALVVDYAKLKNLTIDRKLSEVIKNREDIKKYLSVDQREKNISSYLSKITISLRDLNIQLRRCCGGTKMGFDLFRGNNLIYLKDFIVTLSNYIKSVDEESDVESKFYSESLLKTIHNSLSKSYNNRFFDILLKKCAPDYRKLVAKIFELNDAIYEKSKEIRVDTIDDALFFEDFLITIRRRMLNDNRFDYVYLVADRVNNYIDTLSDNQSDVDYFLHRICRENDVDKFVSNIDAFIKYVKSYRVG